MATKTFTTYHTNEEGKIIATTQERQYIKYSVSSTGKVTLDWGHFLYFVQKLKER